MLVLKLSLLAALVLPACTIPNDAHCGNQNGDATCAARYGEAMFCDVCVSANDGCVESIPDEACRFEEHGTGSASTTTSAIPIDPSEPSTTVGSVSASGGSTSDDPTTPANPTSDDGSTSDAPSTTDPASSSTTTEPTDSSDTSSATEDSTDATTNDASTGDACLGLGAECDEPEDCCGGLCLPDLVLGIDVCV